MKRTVYRRILLGLIICNFAALVTYGYYLLKTSVPDEMKILLGQEEEFQFSVPIHASISEDAVGVLYVNEEPLSKEDITIDLRNPVSISSNELGTYGVKLSLFGIVPIKEISLEVIEKIEVVPGGSVIGLQVETDGILVLGTGSVMGKDGAYHEPASRDFKKRRLYYESKRREGKRQRGADRAYWKGKTEPDDRKGWQTPERFGAAGKRQRGRLQNRCVDTDGHAGDWYADIYNDKRLFWRTWARNYGCGYRSAYESWKWLYL